MAEVEIIEPQEETPPRKRKRRWAKRIGWALAILLAPMVLALIAINSPFGKRLIADQIAQVAPASGLRFTVGRIDGDLYGEAVLHDVVVYDPKGEFLVIPRVELDWRPLAWLTSGLDVRELSARRGTLSRWPELLPGDPDAPILPDFDIRVDKLEIDNLTIAPGVVNDEAQRVDMTAKADIRAGRVYLDADGTLGREDKLALLLHAEPDGDRFDLALDYRAPKGGVIAGMIGAEEGYRARIEGDGTWSRWLGHALVQRQDERFAAFRITNRAGEYGIVGLLEPEGVFEGLLGRALGSKVALSAKGTLEDSVVDGRFELVTSALDGNGEGAIDLADNAFDGLRVEASLLDPELFGEGLALSGARIDATLDGAFRDLSADHQLAVGELVSGETQLLDLAQSGTARYDGSRWTVPLDVDVGRVVSGSDWIDPRLVDGSLEGTLQLVGDRLLGDNLRIAFPGLSARLALRGNLAQGAYALAGPVEMSDLTLENIGVADANAKIVFKTAGGASWNLRANFAGQVTEVSNATIANLAGPRIRLKGGIGIGGNDPLTFRDVDLEAEKLTLRLDGSVAEGRTTLAGSGRHTQYGPFTIEAALAADGPQAVLVFSDPLPSAGLKDVRVALAPSGDGFAIETAGQSMLGDFAGNLALVAPADGPTVIDISSLRVWKTDVSGQLTLAEGGARGTLALAGGGLNGNIALAPRGGGQGFIVDLTARNARFGGETAIALGEADIDADILLVDGNNRIQAQMTGRGISYGNLFVGRLEARANVTNGKGDVVASLSGRRGSRFNMLVDADVTPDQVAVLMRGRFSGERITMPRRAVLTRMDGGGWRLAPAQIGYGRGRVIAAGAFGGGETALDLKLANMPLSLADVPVPDLGLGGTISGVVEFRSTGGVPPTGSARVKIDDLTRSGLVLSSRPVDLALVANLTASRLEARAAIEDEGRRIGRLQARITDLPSGGPLFDRLQAGNLFGQLRYQGAADALWRLAAVDGFDLTGPVAIAADVTGSLAQPRVRGSLSSDDLRVQSSLSGTDIREVKAKGTFIGSRLRITSFRGKAPNGGTITGGGIVDLADLSPGRGPVLDLKAAAKNARLLNANGLSATVTGPLRIVSDGDGGTIAGRLRVDRASWSLGTAAEDARLPNVTVREINMPPDIAPLRAPGAPWRYLIDATARSRIEVDGMGLDSEWGADVLIRGTTEDPRIGGNARVVRGAYSFAGTRFELTRGRIEFDENVPIDPRLDIEAETEKDGLSVTVNVTGNAQQPEITFASNPALPEEEILSRLLFGSSITNLSATDALQLGSALASLRGGGGMDPINQLRSSIGLDRLRIVGADPALDRGTGVALGKNLGRRFYVEIITDGRGYSATEVEFRITSWLALLGSVSTIGRNNVLAEVSKDY
ncbi:translocation/assembly module TamB domain-containing protein [Altererythrobacter arenosus]|uniref:Translocation/assembly module TamB domain-containing protein n=1 Tax=Altererythrobacter arenosus TaxID=3032592 RepID=A0ABY8FSN1_9SPHN|nr:translocation/assembly module TamB domain-containing protein [Altererythrobacter sp. CAU 1644]WFL78023.1 translocation/assembly module TamB domain-containing protein [Altererythrobacter sp. CAU 1644]